MQEEFSEIMNKLSENARFALQKADFYSKRFDTEVRSIIKVRAVHIISAGLSSLLVPAYTYLKNKKGREKNGR